MQVFNLCNNFRHLYFRGISRITNLKMLTLVRLHNNATDVELISNYTDLSNAFAHVKQFAGAQEGPRASDNDFILRVFQWLVVCIGVTGILANGSLFLVLLSKQLRKRTTNKLITNQVLLDLISSILIVITFAIQLSSQEFEEIGGLAVCVFFDSYTLVYMAVAGSNAGLVMITLERLENSGISD